MNSILLLCTTRPFHKLFDCISLDRIKFKPGDEAPLDRDLEGVLYKFLLSDRRIWSTLVHWYSFDFIDYWIDYLIWLLIDWCWLMDHAIGGSIDWLIDWFLNQWSVIEFICVGVWAIDREWEEWRGWRGIGLPQHLSKHEPPVQGQNRLCSPFALTTQEHGREALPKAKVQVGNGLHCWWRVHIALLYSKWLRACSCSM